MSFIIRAFSICLYLPNLQKTRKPSIVLKEILIALYLYQLQSTTNTQLTNPSKNRTIMRFGVQQALIVFICKTKSRSTLERDFYLIKARNPVPHGTGL